ncbi:unnamed protein product, partial [Coregonus sp. 'balchen']
VSDTPDVQKQNCPWLFITHKKCHMGNLMSGLEKSCGDAVLKFEPFVLHVQCRQLEDAQLLKLFVLFCVNSPCDISLSSPKYPWPGGFTEPQRTGPGEGGLHLLPSGSSQSENGGKCSTSGYSLLCNQLNLKAQVDRMTEEKTVYKRRRKRGQTY